MGGVVNLRPCVCGDVCDRLRWRKQGAKRSGSRRRVAVNPISRYDAVTATGGKAAIIPHYSEAIDEDGEYYEKVSYYCECTKCGISTPFMSCEEAAVDCWEGD